MSGGLNSIASKTSIAHSVCIHVVPHFGGVLITMSPGRKAKPSHRALSATTERYLFSPLIGSSLATTTPGPQGLWHPEADGEPGVPVACIVHHPIACAAATWQLRVQSASKQP